MVDKDLRDNITVRRNGVSIIVDKDLKDDVITVSRKGDRIILVKLTRR